MTQNSAQFPTLPQTHVLSYLTAINTPPRVRLVASRALMIVGLLAVAGATAGLYVLGRAFIEPIAWVFGPGFTLPRLLDAIREEFMYVPGGAIRITLLLVTAPALLSPALTIFARAVYAGRRIPALLASGFLLVPIGQILLYAAIYYGWAIIMSLPIHGEAEPDYLVRFLTLPIPVLAVLLLLDLRTFLRWIARNPAQEKPPTPFLPRRTP